MFNKVFILRFFLLPKRMKAVRACPQSQPITISRATRYTKEHLLRKWMASPFKAVTKSQGGTDPNTAASCFDLQKVLLCPHGEAFSSYYKPQLAVYKLTFCEMTLRNAEWFLWPEQATSRGGKQIAPYLWHCIVEQTVLKFVSNNCAGQNRKRIIGTMFWFAMKSYVTRYKVELCFLETEHIQNGNVSVHAAVAQAVKEFPVFTPQHLHLFLSLSFFSIFCNSYVSRCLEDMSKIP